MKIMIDLPDGLHERIKIAAARQRFATKEIVIEGLEQVFRDEASFADALAHLRQGYRLGGQPLNRESAHAN